MDNSFVGVGSLRELNTESLNNKRTDDIKPTLLQPTPPPFNARKRVGYTLVFTEPSTFCIFEK
jgi:hypothetical protein